MTERFAAGTRIGDYLLDGSVASTSSVLSYHATHVLLPRRALIQVLHPAFLGLASVSVQLIREGCILEALHHLGAPRMFECGVLPDRRPWLATELVVGESLEPLTEPLPVAAVVTLLRDVAEVLEHAHRRGVVHRNLRPAAIVRCDPSRGFGHCIIDWSHARTHDTATQVPTGSPAYRAPELASGAFDGRADVFSLGVIAYEVLTRALPTMSAAQRCPGVPAGVTSLLDRMLDDARVRPTATEVRVAAAQLADIVELVPVEDVAVATEEITLVELAEEPGEPEPPVINRRLKWTPATGLATQPGIHRARTALKRGRP